MFEEFMNGWLGTRASKHAVEVISSIWSWAAKRDEPGVVQHLQPMSRD